MKIDVLICHADGRQEMVQREVAEDYFNPTPAEPTLPAKGESAGK